MTDQAKTDTKPVRQVLDQTILFVDVVRSTELYEFLGNKAALERLSPCLQALSEVAQRHGGREVKSLGDGLLLIFEGELAGVEAAFEMLDSALTHRVRVRAGLHAGDVLEKQGDVYGQTVNTAARICSLAQPSEVLVSAVVYGRLPLFLQQMARSVQHPSLKGVQDSLELFGLVPEDSSNPRTTAMVRQPTLPEAGVLELVNAGRTWRVDPTEGFKMGRGAGNNLVVKSERVSRNHANISLRRAKFVLKDESVNGTWLVPDGGSCQHLLREESVLNGSGHIYLGLPPEQPDTVKIAYRVRD